MPQDDLTITRRLHAATQKLASHLGGFSLANRALVGLGLATALFFCAMLTAGMGTHTARTHASSARSIHIPLMQGALELESAVYEVVFHASMFGLSGDMASYSEARIRFSTIRDIAAALSRQTEGIPENQYILRDLALLRESAARLDVLVEKKRTINETLEAERARLRKTADIMGEILLELQARTASATTAKGNDKNLDEKARLLILNGFALAVEEVSGRALSAGLTRSLDDLAEARSYFALRWDDAVEACRIAAELPASGSGTRQQDPLADDLTLQVAEFRATMQSIYRSLEEAMRANRERSEVIVRLTTLTRGTVDYARTGVREAADNVDVALRGVTAALFICAFLVCLFTAGAAFLFFRSRFPSSLVTTRDGQGILQ